MPAGRLPTLSESPGLRAGVFFGLYAVQGIPSGFALTAVANYLTARGLDSGAITAFVARIGIPWSIQFAWGPLIDRFQGSPMGRRKPWVLGAQFLAFAASLGLLLVRDPARELTLLSWAFLVHGLFASIQDASVDAMAVSIIPERERGRINAFMRAGLILGFGAGAAAWATLIHRAGFQAAALAQSGVLLAMATLTLFVRERPGDALAPWGRAARDEPAIPLAESPGGPSVGRVVAELARGLFSPPSLATFGVVVVVYTAISVFIRAYSWDLIKVLHWTDEEASVTSGTYGTALGLAAALGGGWIADRVGARRMMVAVMIGLAAFLLGFGALGPWWPYRPLAASGLVLWSTVDPSFSVACMPVLMGLCRKGVEGSQFTAYMALVNLSSLLGNGIAGHAVLYAPTPAIALLCGGAVIAACLTAVAIPPPAGPGHEGR